MFRVCHAFLSVYCSLVVICCEKANLLALLYVVFSSVFVTLPCGVLGQVWNLTVSIHDLYLLTYFENTGTDTSRSNQTAFSSEVLTDLCVI